MPDAPHPTENELPGALLHYFASRRAHESALTNQAWSALTPREQALVREAAVMGFVRGQFYGTERRTPKDSAIVADVLTQVRGFVDLYPTLNNLTSPTPPEPVPVPADAALDCTIAGCRWGDPTSSSCQCPPTAEEPGPTHAKP